MASTKTVLCVAAIAATASFFSLYLSPLKAAELKVLSAVAMQPALDDLGRDFERKTGHKVTLAYATAGIVRDRIRNGEPADVVIAPRSAFEPLSTQGKIAPGSEVRLAQSLVAVAVPAGAAKPDISSPDALKRGLLAAKSIVYPDPAKGGATGIHAARVIERLGITEQMKSKTTLVPGSEYADILAKRQAELAIVQPMVVMTFPGVDLVGPLPAELQNTTDFVFMSGVSASAAEPALAKTFIEFLRSPDAARVIKAKGMEPG
ncbi:MAG TPA: molybdate ABC transporter substrate-binding protein [Pseudolabrys sp.]|jgi:molybdate transport system substrate-binding protein